MFACVRSVTGSILASTLAALMAPKKKTVPNVTIEKFAVRTGSPAAKKSPKPKAQPKNRPAPKSRAEKVTFTPEPEPPKKRLKVLEEALNAGGPAKANQKRQAKAKAKAAAVPNNDEDEDQDAWEEDSELVAALKQSVAEMADEEAKESAVVGLVELDHMDRESAPKITDAPMDTPSDTMIDSSLGAPEEEIQPVPTFSRDVASEVAAATLSATQEESNMQEVKEPGGEDAKMQEVEEVDGTKQAEPTQPMPTLSGNAATAPPVEAEAKVEGMPEEKRSESSIEVEAQPAPTLSGGAATASPVEGGTPEEKHSESSIEAQPVPTLYGGAATASPVEGGTPEAKHSESSIEAQPAPTLYGGAATASPVEGGTPEEKHSESSIEAQPAPTLSGGAATASPVERGTPEEKHSERPPEVESHHVPTPPGDTAASAVEEKPKETLELQSDSRIDTARMLLGLRNAKWLDHGQLDLSKFYEVFEDEAYDLELEIARAGFHPRFQEYMVSVRAELGEEDFKEFEFGSEDGDPLADLEHFITWCHKNNCCFSDRLPEIQIPEGSVCNKPIQNDKGKNQNVAAPVDCGIDDNDSGGDDESCDATDREIQSAKADVALALGAYPERDNVLGSAANVPKMHPASRL